MGVKLFQDPTPEPNRLRKLRNDPWFVGIVSGLIVTAVGAATLEVIAYAAAAVVVTMAVVWLARDYWRLRRAALTTTRLLIKLDQDTAKKLASLQSEIKDARKAPAAGRMMINAANAFANRQEWAKLLERASADGWHVQEAESATGLVLYTFTIYPGGYQVSATSSEEPKAVLIRLREASGRAPRSWSNVQTH